MAAPGTGNVVSLGDHPRARARLSPRESADVLTGCRDLALERMGRSLAGMLDRLEDDLYELASKATDREVQNTYLDARAQARENRAAMESAFRKHFVEFFNRKVQSGTPAPAPENVFGELRLVEEEDLEETIAVREMSRKLGAACEDELFALSQRMGFLLERPELDDEANPMSPSTICSALKDACDQIEAGFKVRLALLRQFEHYATQELQVIYHDLNAHLVERHQILPEVRLGVRRNANAARREGPPPAPTAPAKDKPADLFETLAQWLGQSLGAGGAADGGLPNLQAAQAVATVPASFLSELTRMHRDAPSQPLTGHEALVNVVKGIRAAPQAAALGTVDAMTIDLVSMLFDYIFEDRHIPTRVKAALGRLQIPTLKVALLDKDFFSTKSHPARRLIDLLAECAIGVDEANAGSAEALDLVDSVVQDVLKDFDTDLAPFEAQLVRVEAFIEERRREEAEIVERSARLVEHRERIEMANAFAQDEVRRRIDASSWLPVVVREMLEQTWVRALAEARLAEGENSSAWAGLARTMEDLIWSVEPKSTPEDRKRLVTMLPALLKALIEGLRRGGLEADGRDRFLGALVDCHAMAMKAGMRGLAVVPPVPAPLPPAEPLVAREVVPVGNIAMEEIRLRTDGRIRNVFTRTGIWTNLQRGTWVEFKGASSAARARLTWISPNKGVYLFTNPLTPGAAVSISPEALAEEMRLGKARILNDAPLVERAVDSMLEQLRRGGAAA